MKHNKFARVVAAIVALLIIGLFAAGCGERPAGAVPGQTNEEQEALNEKQVDLKNEQEALRREQVDLKMK